MQNEGIPEFGIKRENEERRDGGCGVIFDPETGLFAVGKRGGDGFLLLFSGGVEAGEDIHEGILREVREESGLHDFKHVEQIAEAKTHYYNDLKKVNRVAHARCLLAILNSRTVVPTRLEAHEKFTLHWTTADELLSFWEGTNGEGNQSHWIYFVEKAVKRLAEIGYPSALKCCSAGVHERLV